MSRSFDEILESHLAGSPMRVEVRWTHLKTVDLVRELAQKGITASRYIVQQLTAGKGLVQRQMSKVLPGKVLPGKVLSTEEVALRDEQFHKIAEQVSEFTRRGLPVLSIDTKKKESIGQLYRSGKSYCREALKVHDHDFVSLTRGVVVPHGIYDLTKNTGYMSLGTSKDTSESFCDNLRHHWHHGLQPEYPGAGEMLLLMDGGGSNSCLHYIVKEDRQKLAQELQVKITVAHYPAYCSKYNPIEHRLFPHIQRSWDGVLFENYQVVKEQVEKTTTTTGLQVVAWINQKKYQTGRKYSEGFKENMTICFDPIIPKWNYRIEPL